MCSQTLVCVYIALSCLSRGPMPMFSNFKVLNGLYSADGEN